MSRQRRILFPGAVYHVMSRGNERRPIYRDDADREAFLDLLGRTVERYGWLCHGYCLMGNHYHLIVETPRPNLAEGMRHLNGCHAHRFNGRHVRAGHLFQGRYRCVLVEKDAYLLELVRYVHLNPVRAGLRLRPEQWRWSSYPALLGVAPRPRWLAVEWLLGQYGDRPSVARRRLQAFVEDADAVPPPPVRHGLYLATDGFLRGVIAEEERPIPEVPRRQWQPLRPPLEEILRTSRDPLREAHERWGYTLREIGLHTGRHASTISRRIRRAKSRR